MTQGDGGSGFRAWLTKLATRPVLIPLVAAAALLAATAGPAAGDESWIGVPELVWLQAVVIGVVVVLALLGLVIVAAVFRNSTGRHSEQRLFRGTATTVLICIMLALALARVEPEPPPPEETQVLPERAAEVVDLEQNDEPRQFDPASGLALAAIATAAGILLWWSQRSGSSEPEASTASAAPEPLTKAVEQAAAYLLDETDPRSAVLLAYHQLEQALVTLGLPRGEAETPTEHLSRSLTALAVDGDDRTEPMLELAGLYSRARYSDHQISTDEQRQAGLALQRSQATLDRSAR
jgi:flagellar basal body-associated protein FliL